MSDNKPTYDLAKADIGAYVQPLWQGALAMPFDVHDEAGRKIRLADDHLSGRYLLLAFMNDIDDDRATALLGAIAAKADEFEHLNTEVVAFNSSSNAAQNRALKQAAGFPWPLAGDATGVIFASYGLHKENDEAIRLVLLTPYRQVRTWFDTPDDNEKTLKTIMDVLEGSQAAEEMRWSAPHPPILLVPNVLSGEECAALIETFETGCPFMIRPPRQGEVMGNYKIPVYEHNRQDRVDQIIKDRKTLDFLDERIFGRITPMIQKAFAFEVTAHEDLHIARYVGERGGNHMGHRDNTSPSTAYRRFALSMALNEDFEGGDIVFKEFSSKGYNPPPGTAMIFSSSLLHEVEETTSGVRYNLISHLFNKQALGG